jgi:hypothetical protein
MPSRDAAAESAALASPPAGNEHRPFSLTFHSLDHTLAELLG